MSTANFRTSLGGFHRADVVNFIEETSLSHEKALRKLKDEAASLQAQLKKAETERDEALSQLSDVQAQNEAAQEQLATVQAERDQLLTQLAQARQEAEAAQAQVPQVPETQPSPVSASAPAQPEWTELELSAYRRAEAAERGAQQRAKAILSQAGAVVEDTSAKLSASSQELTGLTARVREDLAQLSAACRQTEALLASAAQSLSRQDPSVPN